MIEFSVLGSLTVRRDGEDQQVPTAMLRRLLALLLARPGTPVSADLIIDTLWSGEPPRTARRTLSAYVSRLRHVLGTDDRVEKHPGSYIIRPLAGELDSAEFERLAADATSARGRGDVPAADAAIRAALAMWRGPAYAGLRDVPPVAAEADRLEQVRIALFEDGVDIDLDAGRHADVVVTLGASIAEHPYRERLRGQYMLALYRGGRQAEALEAYRHAYQQLSGDLGIEPGSHLQDLHQRILARDPELDLAGGARRPAAARPNLLPRVAAHFTGRHAQLDELDRLAAGDGASSAVAILSAITGSAGVGKTSLAVVWSRRSAHLFPDGQLYINLQGYGGGDPLNPFGALSHLLRQLGVPADEMPDDEQAAIARYRSILSDTATLVVLDNANAVSQVRPLLPTGSRCMAVVTSRELLTGLVALDGARRIAVDVLPLGDCLSLLGSIVGPDRIAAEPAAAEALATICGRLPLALRIAGAALADDPPGTVADYVALLSTVNRLSHLTIEGDPESSVRTAFSHSYLQLEPDAQRMFRLLGQVPGADIGVPAAAALAGCGADDALRLLSRLRTVHLLRELRPGRFAFHDLIRDYARETAVVEPADSDRDAALDRLIRWYVTQADNGDRALRPLVAAARKLVDPEIPVPAFADAGEALEWYGAEGANLIAMIRVAETALPVACCALVSGSFGWLDAQRRIAEWVEMQTIGVRAACATGDLADEAHMRSGLANALINAGRKPEALPQFERCLAIRREMRVAPRLIVTAMMNVGALLSELGRYAEAIDYQEQVLEMVESSPDLHWVLPPLLSNLAHGYFYSGDLDRATAYYRRGMVLAKEIGDPGDIAHVADGLAFALLKKGDFDEAVAVLEESLPAAIASGHKLYLARMYVTHCQISLATERLDGARHYFGLAMEAFGDFPEPVVEDLAKAIEELASHP